MTAEDQHLDSSRADSSTADSSTADSSTADSSTAQEHEEQDPRPVFEGDWGKASGKERQAHLVRVNAWRRRHPEASEAPRRGKATDPEVDAILGSGTGKARLTSDDDLGLVTLRAVAADPAAPASARVTAASALRTAEAEAARTAAEDERARVTAALAAAPLPERLSLLERIVRRDEPEGWVSVFGSVAVEAAPSAAPAAPADSKDYGPPTA